MRSKLLKAIIALEVMLVIFIIYFDIFIPTLVVIPIMIGFMFIHKENFKLIGFNKFDNYKVILEIFILTIIWTGVNFCIIMPILNHISGSVRDIKAYESIKGNVINLLFFLVVSWLLAAVGEEIVYRGLIQNRIRSLFTNDKIGILLAVTISTILFGLAHREQGTVGIVITITDSLFFNFIRYKYKNLWGAVLAHGFLNSIGLITFYFTGPIYGLW